MTYNEKAFLKAMEDDDFGKPKSSEGRYARQRKFIELYEAAKTTTESDIGTGNG